MSALEEQIGGSHYKTMKIQPMTYSVVNGLNACQHTAIKYITRYRSGKGSPLENIDKAIHTLQLLKELEGLSPELPEGDSSKQPVSPYVETEDFSVDFGEDLVEALYRRVDKIVEERLSKMELRQASGGVVSSPLDAVFPTYDEEYVIPSHRANFLREYSTLGKGGSDAF